MCILMRLILQYKTETERNWWDYFQGRDVQQTHTVSVWGDWQSVSVIEFIKLVNNVNACKENVLSVT